jgi:hypothetical protein
LERKYLTHGIQESGKEYLTISVGARAISVEAVVDETAVTLGEEGVALLHVHAVVAVSWSANGRASLI